MILHVKNKIDFVSYDGTIFLNLNENISFPIETMQTYIPGQEVELWLYMIMREAENRTDIKFYSFENISLIEDFLDLISISGVGPKTAYLLMKSIPKDKLMSIVEQGDFAEIKKIPGIGEATAKRVILELSRKYKKKEDVLNKMKTSGISKDQKEVIETLIKMGYDRTNLMEKMEQLDKNLSKAELLKTLLVELSKK
jgi:holliday junction DNA helicase RuvA